MTSEKIVEFVRKRDYRFIRDLGQGACGKTVLLHDDTINEVFVCKKYQPLFPENQHELFTNFLREIKLLHQVFHPNIVRVFNYYVYPEKTLGYIVMEYVEGLDIEEYIESNPEDANRVFEQTVEAFEHLEANGILHRDLRPANILVKNGPVVKVIDLGFGKKVTSAADYDKSISLNWWCTPPMDFQTGEYSFATEVYFVGKLFEKIIQNNDIKHFKHTNILSKMCESYSDQRFQSFSDVLQEIRNDEFSEIQFWGQELNQYRAFAKKLEYHISKIDQGCKYITSIDKIVTSLETVYKNCMLEESVPDCRDVIRCFLEGIYFYTKKGFPVSEVKGMLTLLRTSSLEKRRIILANLHTRLDSIERYFEDMNDEIPF